MLTAFAIRAVPEARPEAMVTILESTLEKKWVFRKRACHHVVELESLQKLVFWSGYPTMSQVRNRSAPSSVFGTRLTQKNIECFSVTNRLSEHCMSSSS
jgi:hypothetical protein